MFFLFSFFNVFFILFIFKKNTYIYSDSQKNMIIVKVEKGISLEKALKLYKSKIIKTRQSSQLNERKEYEKKSVIKRKQKLNAIYRQKLNLKND